MTDIVKRLRGLYDAGMFQDAPYIKEAADEIERLRGVLSEIKIACRHNRVVSSVAILEFIDNETKDTN